MITHIKISGFKSFMDFEMEFKPLTVIAGLNASGKSNLFDALRLLSAIVASDNVREAFERQRGDLEELFTMSAEGAACDEMRFEVEMLVEPKVTDAWGLEKDLKKTRLRYTVRLHLYTNELGMKDVEVTDERLEAIRKSDDKWMGGPTGKFTKDVWPKNAGRTTAYISTDTQNGSRTAQLHQDGNGGKGQKMVLNRSRRTVLSSVNSAEFPHALAVRKELESWRFMELNPEDLRRPTRKDKGSARLGRSGSNLAAVLYRIKKKDEGALTRIARRINEFIPTYVGIDVIDDQAHEQYVLTLEDTDGRRHTSRVLSEGTLRILTLCILCEDTDHRGLLCFEEPENGINPMRVPVMARLLKSLSADMSKGVENMRQVIVNSHSPQFIESVIKWKQDPNVEVALSRMTNRYQTVEETKRKFCVTIMTPVEPSTNSSMEISDQDSRISMTMLKISDLYGIMGRKVGLEKLRALESFQRFENRPQGLFPRDEPALRLGDSQYQ